MPRKTRRPQRPDPYALAARIATRFGVSAMAANQRQHLAKIHRDNFETLAAGTDDRMVVRDWALQVYVWGAAAELAGLSAMFDELCEHADLADSFVDSFVAEGRVDPTPAEVESMRRTVAVVDRVICTVSEATALRAMTISVRDHIGGMEAKLGVPPSAREAIRIATAPEAACA